MGAYERSAGWLFWNFDNEMGDPRWSFFAAQAAGWFPRDLSHTAFAPRLPDCGQPDTMFGSLIDALSLAVGGAGVALLAAVPLLCMSKWCRRIRREAARALLGRVAPTEGAGAKAREGEEEEEEEAGAAQAVAGAQ